MRRNALSLIKSKKFSCKHTDEGTKFAPLCRRNYRPYGIEILCNLASLLDVFGNISKWNSSQKYCLIEILNSMLKSEVGEMGENFRL